jgi:arylsulfatase A-like enzyme
MSRTKLKIIVIIMLVALVSIGISLGIKNKPKKFNIILIVVDALRADHLSCYGYNRDTSPNIDKFAKEGVLFTHAYSQGAATRISIPSIFTSLYPGVHGVFESGAPLRKEFITLPEILRKYNYITAAICGPVLNMFTNFDYRFDYYSVYRMTQEPNNEFLPPTYRMTPSITQKVKKWLDTNGNLPFFLYVHFLDVHSPFSAPAPYETMFWNTEIDEETKKCVRSSLRFEGQYKKNSSGKFVDYAISQYDAEIRYVDEHIKLILQELDTKGLRDNTLVVIMSDHGEGLGEHGKFFHGPELYEEFIHVPLILRLPGIIPQGKGLDNLVRCIDLMPTILEILNINERIVVQGISLMPIIKGKQINLPVFSESIPKCIVRLNEWKLIEEKGNGVTSSVYELYNISEDPIETVNLIGEKPAVAKRLSHILSSYKLFNKKISEKILKEKYSDKLPSRLDKDKIDSIKSLGYLQ